MLPTPLSLLPKGGENAELPPTIELPRVMPILSLSPMIPVFDPDPDNAADEDADTDAGPDGGGGIDDEDDD